jgi:outer membrane lipoprotein-sorting protein
MVPDNPRAALLAVTFGSLVLLSGVGIGGVVATQQPANGVQSTQPTEAPADGVSENGSSPTGDEIVSSFNERMSSLETLVMTYETNVSVDDGDPMITEQAMWIDYEANRMRTEAETDRTETITVRNESKTVTYDVENNQVNRFDRKGNTSLGTPLDGLVENSEFSYEGRERIDGRLTYRLDVTPTNTSSMPDSVNATVWVDSDTYFPTKTVTKSETDEHDFRMTARFRNVSVNEPIDEDRFTIDIPDDAEEPDYSLPERTTYDSLAELRDNTSRSVPAPDVPDAFSFEQGYVLGSEDYQSITLRYVSEDGETLHVGQGPSLGYDYGESSRYETVDIGNESGYYTEHEYNGNTTAILVIPCEDATYSVSGDVSKDEITDVGTSLNCK